MLEANLAIIGELKQFVSLVRNEPVLLSKFSRSDRSFTRDRKLPFDKLVLLIAKLCKKTLSVEMEDFFGELSAPSPCTVSAFTQQRMKLEPVFFAVWNQLLVDSFYRYYGTAVKRWRGYRVIAADGSKVSLAGIPALAAHFGGQRNQTCSFVQAATFLCHDVLNGVTMFPRIGPYRRCELAMAYDTVNSFEGGMLVIYDRNFCNYRMVALHLWKEKETKFVIRAKETQLWIRDFIASGEPGRTVAMVPTPDAIKGLKKDGYNIGRDTLLRVRLVRVELEKSVEVLVTNLWEAEGHADGVFGELYNSRWGVETSIGHIKNTLRLESFSGHTVHSVEQDFFATVFTANLHAVLIKQAQEGIEQGPQRKHPLKVNKNKSYGKLRGMMVGLFTSCSPEKILATLTECFARDPVPIRKGRSYPRVIKSGQSKNKHKTFTNYKPAF